ncbi:MAG: tetratricopeptide repeat protein [Cytophagia bacterium]|nr:tetratricopeptide repeat protein [Cytophagia bacterium]
MIVFLCLVTLNLFGQDQRRSDSLKTVFRTNDYDRALKLQILEDIANAETDTDEILIYSKELIESAKEMDSVVYIFSGYLQQGNGYRLKSDLSQALNSYFEAAEIALENNLNYQQAIIKISIADVYSIMGDGNTAVSYYRNSIDLLKSESISDNSESVSMNLASAQLNLGDEYLNQKKLDSALYYFSESGKVFEALNFRIGEAYNLGNVGLVYAEKNENEKAEQNLNNAIEVLEELGDYYPICVYLNSMSDIYESKGDDDKALNYVNRSLDLAKKHGLKEQIADAFLRLASFYESKGQFKTSYDYYKNHIIYRDSVNNMNDFQRLADERTRYEVSQKQAEVNLLNQEKKTQRIIAIAIGIALLLLGLLALSLFKRNKLISKTGEIIQAEKERSDELLKNILPDETAKELKEKGFVEAKKFDSVTVLFTDFKGFTKYSESLTPEEIVKSIDFYFSKFDEIIDKYGLEKIKTIGDAYMCAGGLPFPTDDHATQVTRAALEIADFVRSTLRNIAHSDAKFDIRIGINSGPVVAGIVGTKKFAFDIWGRTVNAASRIESSGEIGRVNISENTYNLIKNNQEFTFEYRGEIEAKGMGKTKMYFVQQHS